MLLCGYRYSYRNHDEEAKRHEHYEDYHWGASFEGDCKPGRGYHERINEMSVLVRPMVRNADIDKLKSEIDLLKLAISELRREIVFIKSSGGIYCAEK